MRMCKKCKHLENQLEKWKNDFFKLLEQSQRANALNKVLKQQVYELLEKQEQNNS